MDRSDPDRIQPIREPDHPKYYIGVMLLMLAAGLLPAIAVNWYAIETNSGMHQRISSAMVQIAAFVAGSFAVPVKHEAAERAVVGTGPRPSLRTQLRMAPWARSAATYILATAAAAPVLVADAYGHEIAFPALVCVLLALHVAVLAPSLRKRLREIPNLTFGTVVGIPMGLLVGGIYEREYWIDDPWFWVSAILIALTFLRMMREHVAAKARQWRQRQIERAK
jgi:hypothetical protein